MARGARHSGNTSSLRRRSSMGSIVLLQVHPGVKAGYLLAVAVEHERVALEKVAQAALLGLGPARVIDLGIDVGVKAVFNRVGQVPRRGGHFLDELDFDDGLDAFEAVLP